MILVDKVWPLEHVTPGNLPKINSMRPMARSYNGNGGGNGSNGSENGTSGGKSYYKKPDGENGASSTPKASKPFLIELPKRANRQLIEDLKAILASAPGKQPVELRLFKNESTQVVQTPITVKASPELEERIATLLQTR
jgi:hypothetical protein